MRLDQLGTVERGRSRHRPRNDPVLYGGAYPFVQTGDIKAAGLHLFKYTQTYSDAGLAQSRMWPAGTLCITIAANICDTAILGIPACFPDSIVGFTATSDIADAVFVKYALDYAKRRFTGISHGATQDNLSVEKLLSQRLPVPPLRTQHRIGSILGAYDDLIEVNQRRIAVLEEVARRLHEEWFVNYRFALSEPLQVFESPQGPIPAGWRWSTLGALARRCTAAYSAGSHETLPLLDLARIPRRSAAIPAFGHSDELATSRIVAQRRDVLFAAIRPNLHKVVAAPTDLITNVSVHVIRALSSVFQPYLWAALARDRVVAWATQHANGTKMPTLPWDVFARMPLPLPPIPLVERFNSVVEPTMDAIATCVLSNQLLAAGRDLIMPRLVSGELTLEAVEGQLEAVA